MSGPCRVCQAENPAGRRRCYQCGRPLQNSAPRPPAPTSAQMGAVQKGRGASPADPRAGSALSPLSKPLSKPLTGLPRGALGTPPSSAPTQTRPGHEPYSSSTAQPPSSSLELTKTTLTPASHERLGLAYPELYELHFERDPVVRSLFLFEGERASPAPLPEQARELLRCCAPFETKALTEASLTLALSLPPRSWLQALRDLKPEARVWVWLHEWPEGKTGSQLSEDFPCTLFYGEQGLKALAVSLYRLAPQLLDPQLPKTGAHKGWWAQVRAQASLEEAEAVQRLMSPASLPAYLVELCARRTSQWARRSGEQEWTQLAQAVKATSQHSAREGQAGGALPHAKRALDALKLTAGQWAERTLTHELLSTPLQTQRLKVACLSQLREALPPLAGLFERLGLELSWFKHPQALLNKLPDQELHWLFLLEVDEPWDGADLTSVALERAEGLKTLCFVRGVSPARAARLYEAGVTQLIELHQPIPELTLQLKRALELEVRQKGPEEQVFKRLRAIHQAQQAQRLPLAQGLVLFESADLSAWLPSDLKLLNLLRAELSPRSLPPVSLSPTRVAVCLAEVMLPTLQAFAKQAELAIKSRPIAGAALAEGGRSPERLLSDALGQLEWSREARRPLSWGHWRGGDGWSASAPSSSGALSLQGAGEQVLLIDTDPTSADALKYACEREGLSVTTLSSSKAALSLLQRSATPPALVIAECAPPQSDGLELLRQIRQLPQGQPRVALLVNAKRAELLRDAFEAGAMDVITKPLHMSEALARVLYALKRAPLR